MLDHCVVAACRYHWLLSSRALLKADTDKDKQPSPDHHDDDQWQFPSERERTQHPKEPAGKLMPSFLPEGGQGGQGQPEQRIEDRELHPRPKLMPSFLPEGGSASSSYASAAAGESSGKHKHARKAGGANPDYS